MKIASKIEVTKDGDDNIQSTFVGGPGFWLSSHIHESGNVTGTIMIHHQDDDVVFRAKENKPGITALDLKSSAVNSHSKSTVIFLNDSDLVALRDVLTKRIAAVRRSNQESA